MIASCRREAHSEKIPERAVRPFVVVCVSPRRDASARINDVRENFCAPQFVADATVETLRDSILPKGFLVRCIACRWLAVLESYSSPFVAQVNFTNARVRASMK